MRHVPSQRVTVGAVVAAIIGGFTVASYAPSAPAADKSDEELQEVVVTGSRIARRDNEASSPLVTVDSATLENRSGLNIESYLNQLPTYNPASTPTSEATNSDVQISAINSVGIASISLRGFGANRSLVLVDGRRAVPTNALMVVDTNSIPSSMIRSVEIISGGASATYGADAMGGVSNFLLRRDFQGLQTDFQYGISDVGDNNEFRASLLTGTKIADGRGSIVFAAEYYNREAAYDKNRKFYKDSYSDPTVGSNALFLFGANGWNQSTRPTSKYALGAVTGKAPTAVTGFSGALTGSTLLFNANGSVYNPNGNNLDTWQTTGAGGHPVDGFQFAYTTRYDPGACNSTNLTTCPNGPGALVQGLKYNEVEGYTSSPQTRYAFMGSAKYDITDKLHFMSSARFATSITTTFLIPTNASTGWEVTIPYNATTDSPFLPSLNYADQATLTNLAQYMDENTVIPTNLANPNFIPHGRLNALGVAQAQHPVSRQQAILLNSRTNVYCLTGSTGCSTAANSNLTPTTNTALVGTTAFNGLTGGWEMDTFPLNSFGRRATKDTNEAWQVEAGLTYDLPIKDWTSEIYFSHGESSTYNVAFGNNSLGRWRVENLANDYGFHSNLTANTALPGGLGEGLGVSPGFGTVAVPCTTGFYDTIFKGDAKPSADCQYAVQAPLQTRTQNQQDNFEANFQGGIVNLPAGELRGAFGYQQRRNASQFNPDILQSTASFTDQVIGVYPTGYLQKQTIDQDLWAELAIPVLADLPFLKKLELEVGGRHSSYSTTDSTNTYKINANIQINEWLRFRGGFNRATRAPNLGELYLPIQQIFGGGATYGDPCGLRSFAPFGAGGAQDVTYYDANGVKEVATDSARAGGQTAAGANSAYLICKAQMGAAGSLYFYGDPNGNPATNPLARAVTPQPGGTGGTLWNNQIGNPNLNSEKAKTWTAGMVLQSHFESPLLRRMTATIDWYKISIDDAILPYSGDYAGFLCYGAVQVTSAADAAAQAASPACQNMPRNSVTGGQLSSLISYANQAWVKTTGVDFTVNWSAQLADMGLNSLPGSVGVSVTGTRLGSYKTKQSAANYDPVIEWRGSLGPSLSSFNGGSYDYRFNTNLTYNLPTFGFGLGWRHLPSVNGAGVASQRAIVENDQRVAAGGPGVTLNYTPTAALKVKSYDNFDLTGYYNVTETVSMRFGINNLFDVQPRSVARSAGRPYNTSLSAAQNSANMAAICNGAPGCVAPTGYSLASTGQGSSSGGYYDVVGRRYFVGFKAKF